MENVLAFLAKERDEHLRQIAIIEQMMNLAANETSEKSETKKKERSSVKTEDKDAEEEARILLQREKKRNYKIKQEILDQVVELARAHRESGRSVVKSFPGSFKATQMAEESGRNISTIRKALDRLEKAGLIRKIENIPWDQLGDTPQRQGSIYVATDKEPEQSVTPTPERQWALRNGPSSS